MCASLARETEHRPNLPVECRQNAEVDDCADGKMKRLPPKIILPSFGRNTLSAPPMSDSAVCYQCCTTILLLALLLDFLLLIQLQFTLLFNQPSFPELLQIGWSPYRDFGIYEAEMGIIS